MKKKYAEGIQNEKLLKWGGKCTCLLFMDIISYIDMYCLQYNVANIVGSDNKF